MTSVERHLGSFAVCFWLWFRFAHDRKAWRRGSRPPFGPSRRVSPWFGRQCRCANLRQNARHPSSQLPWRDGSLVAFPRTHDGQPALLAEQHLIASTGHQPAPAFQLFGGAQVSLFPEQVLFEEAIAMLLGEPLAIPGTDLLQRYLWIACPEKPAFARVTLGVTSCFPLDTDHTDFGLGSLPKMHALPTGDDHPLALLIGAFPVRISLAMRLGAAALKEGGGHV